MKISRLSNTGFKFYVSLLLCYFAFRHIDVLNKEALTIALGVFLFAIYDTFIDYAFPPTYKKLALTSLFITIALSAFYLSGGTLYEFNVSLCVGMGLKAIKHGYEYFKLILRIETEGHMRKSAGWSADIKNFVFWAVGPIRRWITGKDDVYWVTEGRNKYGERLRSLLRHPLFVTICGVVLTGVAGYVVWHFTAGAN
ncbi:MAG: hypothetical protein AB7D39_16800 [Pseudodesulfovibrio sp.]|uniref:hypothetical protein n=1 Tax=Pseudodesulfovibrio sp. TaxID=2035812 RepID=UPI003D102936